jgi:tetratricopeptide (TPR) repeat protein
VVPGDPTAASASIPLIARLAHEIPKPKDWQAFQRACVVLFRAELKDPNAQEFGRSGQTQGGIDILGRRDADADHYVGVQCRRVTKPLKQAEILADCRAALGLRAGLKEIIFATTAPDDTGANDAAIAVEEILRAEGHDLSVVIYGWGSLQTLIAIHETAYHAFFPSVVATSAPQPPGGLPHGSDLAAQVASQVVEQIRQIGLGPTPREVGVVGSADEDPGLHARIDAFRDLFKDQQQPLLAEKHLQALLDKESLDGKPWARFRIETNLASIALDLGREAEGASRFEAAYTLQPDNPIAIANLALARTIQGRLAEAMDLARKALDAKPRTDHAVLYLLQAAARSDWRGDPESLIPVDLRGSAHADLGLAEFLRQRNVPHWAERSFELSSKHRDVPEFKRIRAIAVLALTLESGAIVPGARSPVTLDDLNRAADDMKALAEHYLDVGFADRQELVAYLNNAGMLLRLAGRQAECEALLQRGLPNAPNEPQLRRVLALAQVAQGRRADGLATLAADDDPENRLLAAELTSVEDPAAALGKVLAIDPATLNPRVARLRWRLAGELALKTGDQQNLKQAVASLRAFDPKDVVAELLEVRWEQKAGLDESTVHDRLRAVAAELPADADTLTRYLLAEELHDQGLPAEASSLLERYVELTLPSPATRLYLQSLAAARRDNAFRQALAAAAPAVRDDSNMLWTAAAHAWNVGDLPSAYESIEKLLGQEPDNAQARLLKIEILVRQTRSAELLAELEKPVEELPFRRLKDRFRIASLLGHFGYLDRAAALAYRLFLENRDKSQSWMTLCALVLGLTRKDRPGLWDAPVVAPDVAVNLRYDDGEELFIVVEPDTNLRRLDNESWEPDHALVRALMGLAQGARFTDPTGREGMIAQLRHKYVARLHYILQRHEARFPEIEGFRRVPVDVERPGGLDEFIAELKARHDWFEEEQENYRNGPWPLGVLAHRLGLDTIEVAAGLASQGIPLKVAIGNEAEREAAALAVRENGHKGCVLDLLAFWTAWRLQALEAIAATCGPIYLTQSVIDRLRTRRERIEHSVNDGLRSAGYQDGEMVIQEVAPQVVRTWLDDIDRAIAWVETSATVCPLVITDELPARLRDYVRAGGTDIFDSVVLAVQKGVLLVTDDLPTRELSRLIGDTAGACLHQVFRVALDRKQIASDTFIRWSAHLIDAGHNYLGVSGPSLAQSARMDAEAGEAPGYLFRTLSKVIGGRNAEPNSHVVACLGCLLELWSDPTTTAFRQPITGLLLRQLIRERHDDYASMLRMVLRHVQNLTQLVDYMHAWVRGHFLPSTTLESSAPGRAGGNR